jgi:hypothetical protein
MDFITNFSGFLLFFHPQPQEELQTPGTPIDKALGVLLIQPQIYPHIYIFNRVSLIGLLLTKIRHSTLA